MHSKLTSNVSYNPLLIPNDDKITFFAYKKGKYCPETKYFFSKRLYRLVHNIKIRWWFDCCIFFLWYCFVLLLFFCLWRRQQHTLTIISSSYATWSSGKTTSTESKTFSVHFLVLFVRVVVKVVDMPVLEYKYLMCTRLQTSRNGEYKAVFVVFSERK